MGGELVIGFDTAAYLRESCFAIGTKSDVDAFYHRICSVLLKAGHKGALHWRKVRKQSRKIALPSLSLAMKESRLLFLRFTHERPARLDRKNFFLKTVPGLMSRHLELQLREAEGVAVIVSDSDFNSAAENGAEAFLHMLLKRLGSRLANAEVSPKRTGDGFVLHVLKPAGKRLTFIGRIGSLNERPVAVADIALGVIKEAERLPDRVITLDLGKEL